jgi:hypothetical protein
MLAYRHYALIVSNKTTQRSSPHILLIVVNSHIALAVRGEVLKEPKVPEEYLWIR